MIGGLSGDRMSVSYTHLDVYKRQDEYQHYNGKYHQTGRRKIQPFIIQIKKIPNPCGCQNADELSLIHI